MNFTTDLVIGLEIHLQLNTKSKLFCSCATAGNNKPNSRTCPICLGHPGSRPVLNKKALDHSLKLALALGCTISPQLIFSRKTYFYPDLSKNFQITQFEEPLGAGGNIKLKAGRTITLTRIHIEEDPAAISYPETMSSSSISYLDYNRAGNPLVEIVTNPELTSPQEARDFLNRLISIVAYLKIFDPINGIIKADANISIKESGYSRVEIKNITGFKELERALTYEITRQRMLVRRGMKIKRETRGWNDVSKATISLRSKETEADYGYILEPDLPLVEISSELIALLQQEIPELAHQKAARYIKESAIDATDAEVIAMEFELAELFEKVAIHINPKLAARWLRRELLRVLNYHNLSLQEIRFGEKELIELLSLVETKQISDTTAQRLIEKLMEKSFSPKEYVKQNNLMQITSSTDLRQLCRQVIQEQDKAVRDYRAGNEKSFHFLVGQVMRLTKGKAEPGVVNALLKEEMNHL